MKYLIVLGLICSMGCATAWRKSVSGAQVGCDEDSVEISNIRNSMMAQSWVAVCQNQKFYCNSNARGGFGNNDVKCTKALQPSSLQ